MKEIPRIPKEFKSGVVYTIPKGRSTTVHESGLVSEKWTKEEEEWCWNLYKEGYNYKQIALSVDRPYNSVSIKMKRLKKKHYEYNEKHKDDKYATNELFLETVGPIKTVLDVYCGFNKFYSSRGYLAVNNDINKDIDCDYHMDAKKLLETICENDLKFDLVDLDSFGATIELLPYALKIAKKSIVMTLGELGHRRWKRLDYISKHYNTISKVEDITVDNFVAEIVDIAKIQGVNLIPVFIKDYGNIGRVWFKIGDSYDFK